MGDARTAYPSLTFLGAAGTVTGSRFLVEDHGVRVLVDAGLFQGVRELRRRNWEPFAVPAGSIAAVVLSHAHLDHCGYLPCLTREGFAGPVYCTEGTARLAEIVLRDSARLQEEDARYAAERGTSKHSPPRPLYDEADAEQAIRQFRPVSFGSSAEVAPGFHATLRPAGHILGAATVELGVASRTVLFSGDLGRSQHPLLRAPAAPPVSDVTVVESTYGDRAHAPVRGSLAEPVRHTLARGGVVLIPAFAVDRTEVVLMELRRLTLAGEIPHVPVYVDSPMALAALSVYREAIRVGSPELRDDATLEPDVFDPGDLREARTVDESIALNDPGRPCIVVSASGMATGGRVVHHLASLLPDPRNTVILAGYQAVGTRARDLAEGARQLKIHGRYVSVRADIVDCPEFSVHADAGELVAWLASAPEPPTTTYVVHGEPESAQALAARIADELDRAAVCPRPGERVLVR